jgi:hypothetical protein
MTASIAIYTIAETVVLVVKDGTTFIPFELDKREALDIAGGLAVAIHRIGRGETVAANMTEFMREFQE